MDYPQDFPIESRGKVEAARIWAGRRFDSEKAKAQRYTGIEALFWTYVLTPFLVFAEESCRLALWPADEMDRQCREFLRGSALNAYCEKGKAVRVSDPISNKNGSIRWELQQEIEKTSHWRKYENIRLRFALKAGRAESPGVQNSDKTTQAASMPSRVHKGQFCDQVIAETKRIRNLVLDTGRTVAQVEQEHPAFAAWKVRAQLGSEDQDVFNHPRQWGPVVGYAKSVLGKIHGVSPHTITSWVKAHRKAAPRAKKP